MSSLKEQLVPDRLIAEARKRSSLDDLGDEAFRDALGPFIDSLLVQEHQFSDVGKMMVVEEIIAALEKRLRIQEYFRQHSDALDEKISRPIFITGLYRSGTTRLLNLLGSDPTLMYLPNWMTVYPVPLPEAKPGDEEDPRIEKAQASLDMLRARAPHATAAHPLTAWSPSEEFPLMTLSFRGMDAKHLRTNFSDWLAAQDNGPMYSDLHSTLKALQHQFKGPETAEHRFVLKAPIHLGNLDLLFREFPDARVLITHRDPFSAVHSFAMVRESLRGMYCDEVDPMDMGTEILEQASRAVERSVAVRPNLPENGLLDLPFDDIINRLPERLEDIYSFIGAPLTDDARKALDGEEANAGEHRSRATKKDPALYGLTRERVYAAMPDYLGFANENVGQIVAK